MNLEQLIIHCLTVMFTLNVDCKIWWSCNKLLPNQQTSFSLRTLAINKMFEEDSIGDINIVVGNTRIGYIECAQILQIHTDAQIFTERDSFNQCLMLLKQIPAMMKGDMNVQQSQILTPLQLPLPTISYQQYDNDDDDINVQSQISTHLQLPTIRYNYQQSDNEDDDINVQSQISTHLQLPTISSNY